MVAASLGGADSDSAGEWSEVESVEGCVVARWARLVRHYRRIRRLQRIWHNIGQALQGIEKAARERVQRVWPPPRR